MWQVFWPVRIAQNDSHAHDIQLSLGGTVNVSINNNLVNKTIIELNNI